ncbi:extensin-like [Pararge aegeria]|nr:extensin-like [Pararge aegeria]
MAAQQCLPLLCIILAGVYAEPTPGRIPKVYNALITSNQNLEPSKAYPVYQPVLHNAFPFPYQPVFYGDIPLTNGLIPAVPAARPQEPSANPKESPPSPTDAPAEPVPSEQPSPSPQPEQRPVSGDETAAPAPSPPEPPRTESPIPLNEFGLPPQILPLGGGHFSPAYQYTQLAFPYTYPGLRFYDPYNPFGFQPYGGLPLYQPLTNILGAGAPVPPPRAETPVASPVSSDKTSQTPPPEPSDLNLLNYSSKDPAIPNVPPPPLPKGGLKTNAE